MPRKRVGGGEEEAPAKNAVEYRIWELDRLAEALARAGQRLTIASNSIKVLTITLGAMAAAKGSVDTLLGATSALTSITFALIGVLVSVATGVEAAFKLEKRGGELVLLATSCRSDVRLLDSRWREIEPSPGINHWGESGDKLVAQADEMLTRAQDAAAKLGVNFAVIDYDQRRRHLARIRAPLG